MKTILCLVNAAVLLCLTARAYDGLVIDPATGLPIAGPNQSLVIDPATGLPTDLATGLPLFTVDELENEVRTNQEFVARQDKDVKAWLTKIKRENTILNTNNFGPLTLSLSSGRVVSNAYIYKLEFDRAFWTSGDGVIGSVYPTNMPVKMLTKFGYNPEVIKAIQLTKLLRKQTNDLAILKAFHPPPEDHQVTKILNTNPDDDFVIGHATAKVTEDNNTWQRWSYKIPVSNYTGHDSSWDIEIKFFDASGFLLESDTEYRVTLSAYEQKTLTGYSLIDHPKTDLIKTFEVVKKYRHK